jgi:hypothetical protein
MNSELERVWKEAVVAHFETIFRGLPRETEENHDGIVNIGLEIGAVYLPNTSRIVTA